MPRASNASNGGEASSSGVVSSGVVGDPGMGGRDGEDGGRVCRAATTSVLNRSTGWDLFHSFASSRFDLLSFLVTTMLPSVAAFPPRLRLLPLILDTKSSLNVLYLNRSEFKHSKIP